MSSVLKYTWSLNSILQQQLVALSVTDGWRRPCFVIIVSQWESGNIVTGQWGAAIV